MSAAEARRQARLELGNPEEAREVLREGRTGSWLDPLLKDAGYALRLLRKRPALSAACLLTVALGVGASTALFAVVDGVVRKPLPLPDPASLVRIYDSNLAKGVERTGITSGNLQDWRHRTRSFRGIAGHYTMGRTLTLDGESEVVLSAQVTEDFFSVLGVRAALGRTFTPEETRIALFNSAAAPVSPDPVVVLGHGLWQRRFGARPRRRRAHGPGRAPADAGGGRDAGRLRDARAGRAAVPALGPPRDAAARPALRVRPRAARPRRDARAGRGGARAGGGRPGGGAPPDQRRLEREARAAAGRPGGRRAPDPAGPAAGGGAGAGRGLRQRRPAVARAQPRAAAGGLAAPGARRVAGAAAAPVPDGAAARVARRRRAGRAARRARPRRC